MKRVFLLTAMTVLLSLGVQAQYVDVTSKYIANAGFEECEALSTVVYHDKFADKDIDKIELYQEGSVAKGTDYEAQGWKLVEQQTAVNGGVVTYNCNIQTGKWTTAGEPGPAQGISGEKGLCFVGNKGLVYQQANEITLPAGTYRFTVNLYARNGQTTNMQPTVQVVNNKTGFMPTGGTEDDLIPAKRVSQQYASNAWDQEVIDIELTEPKTGRFQLSYGTSYFVVVDDVKLEYLGGVVTTPVIDAVDKAEVLNAQLNDATLASAITAANAFIADPTSQDAVLVEAEKVYTAMATALAATTSPIDITATYVENASFETGKITPWQWGGTTGSVGEPINPASQPYIDGGKVMEFANTGSNKLQQTISHLPAGCYLLEAKLNQNASLLLGTLKTACTGGTDALYLRVHSDVLTLTEGGDLVIGLEGSKAYRADAFRLFYGKDEASLQAAVLPSVKTDAEILLAQDDFQNVTGEERTELQQSIAGTDAAAITAAANNFYKAKDAYDNMVKAKAAAAAYTSENYPYAKETTLQTIQMILSTQAVSRSMALEQTSQLTAACKSVVLENAYCEGVEKTDCTSQVMAADATETTLHAAWMVNNMEIRSLTARNARIDREGTADRVVYGTTEAYKNADGASASMQQTVKNLPAGTYVVALSLMASTDLSVAVRVNNSKLATFTGKGTLTSAGWDEVVCTTELAEAGNLTIRVEEDADKKGKEWFADNFRLYCLGKDTKPIDNAISSVQADGRHDGIFDLQGRRVAAPQKGLYIVNGKKVVVK